MTASNLTVGAADVINSGVPSFREAMASASPPPQRLALLSGAGPLAYPDVSYRFDATNVCRWQLEVSYAK